MQTTGNYGLKKPDGTDTVDISILNGNMDIVDAELKKRALVSQIPTIPSSLPANGGNSATVGGFSASGTPSTAEKSNLVGMINELFQSGTNGKNDIYNAISAKGTTPVSKNFSDLVSAIGNISTGKHFASGTNTANNQNIFTVSGLTFTPSIVISYGSVYEESWRFVYQSAFDPKSLNGTNSLSDIGVIMFLGVDKPAFGESEGARNVCHVTNGGFTIFGIDICNWIAIE